LQWIVVFALIITLLSDDPRGVTAWLVDLGTITLTGLTGPFIIFLLPLFLARALRRRTQTSWLVLGFVAVIAAPQAWQVGFHSPPPPPTHPQGPVDFYHALIVISDRIPISLLGGKLWVQSLSPALAALVGIIFIAFFVWIVTGKDDQRSQRLTLSALLLMLLIVAIVKTRIDFWPHGDLARADRYLFIPKIIVLWSIASAAGRQSIRGRAAAGMLLIAGAAAIIVLSLDPLPRHDWPVSRERLSGGKSVEVEINPGWGLTLPPREQWH
jgi:hypothetical protein